MVDWTGQVGTPTAERYRSMAELQLHEVSATYERLCLGVAGDAGLLDRLDTVPPPKRQPNLLLGAVRYIDGPIGSYDAFRAFVLDRWDDVEHLLRTRRTQTNEARRCATFLPALAALPQPIALLEVGASAGLCLHPDRYRYRYRGSLDADVGAGAVRFECRTAGPVPDVALPQVAWRGGLDLEPLDVTSDDDVRWLRSLIWPELQDRFAHFDAAVAATRTEPVPIRRGDLTTDLAAAAADAPDDVPLVVFHSAVLAYLDDDGRAAFRAEIDALAADRPLVWLANEGPGVVVDVAPPAGAVPFVLSRGTTPLAFADPHGGWLEWLA